MVWYFVISISFISCKEARWLVQSTDHVVDCSRNDLGGHLVLTPTPIPRTTTTASRTSFFLFQLTQRRELRLQCRNSFSVFHPKWCEYLCRPITAQSSLCSNFRLQNGLLGIMNPFVLCRNLTPGTWVTCNIHTLLSDGIIIFLSGVSIRTNLSDTATVYVLHYKKVCHCRVVVQGAISCIGGVEYCCLKVQMTTDYVFA